MLNRRQVVVSGLSVGMVSLPSWAKAPGVPAGALDSDVIYVSPLKSDGEESRCQAEVWFAHLDDHMYVVTPASTWRAQAVIAGLHRARVWVGDVGPWSDSKGKYRSLPQVDTLAEITTDKRKQSQVLDLMKDKYSLQWLIWGPRFNNGLADGSRVMLRYSVG